MEGTETGLIEKLSRESLRPLMGSFHGRITAEQWNSLKSGSPDEATKSLLAELILEALRSVTNGVMAALTDTNVPESEENHLPGLVPQTPDEAFPGQVNGVERLSDLMAAEVREIVRSATSSGSQSREPVTDEQIIPPHRLDAMIDQYSAVLTELAAGTKGSPEDADGDLEQSDNVCQSSDRSGQMDATEKVSSEDIFKPRTSESLQEETGRELGTVQKGAQRAVQTVQAQQCSADVSTQTTGIGCYVSCRRDGLVTPGNYTRAEGRGGAALCSRLEQETQSASGRHDIATRADNRDKTNRKLLDKSAAPHQWQAADGRLMAMDTQHTIRARELRDLYDEVNLSAPGREPRLYILTKLRRTVKEHNCPLTRDILDLIDREEDLIKRDEAANPENLRKRISSLFLQYIKTPEFNPEVAKLLRVPQNPSQVKNHMFLCRSCGRYLHSANFSPSAGARLIRRCRACTGLDHIARSRDDSSCHAHILKRLRADEQGYAGVQIPFLLQVEDMKFLVEVIWASRSALGAGRDLYDLVFVRWERHKDWSPWNCILLTKEEASAHMEVEDVHKAYEATFIHSIGVKHRLARRHFSRIPVIARYLDARLDAQLAADLDNWHVSEPVAMATDELVTDTPPASAREPFNTCPKN